VKFTSIVVPSYAYTVIKIGFLKQLVMDEVMLQKLDEITDIREFVDFISRYYPGLNFNTYTIEEIEKALFHNYIKLIGKIIQYSPLNMRIFLRDYLMKYEITNIKRIILGTILGMNAIDKSLMVNKLVEKYLNHTDFINKLIEIPSLDELQLFMRSTKYNKVIREGILYFKNTNEIFVLEAFLDQLYYNNMKRDMKHLNKKEMKFISLYTEYISEIYNLNLIYRSIINNIDRNLILQLLAENFLFFDKELLHKLMNLTNIEDFYSMLNQHLKKNKEIKFFLSRSPLNREHLIWSLEKLYLDYYFKTFEMKLDDIEYQAIYKILEVLIKKDKEIRLYILPKVVDILHEKYQLLK
jgi:vacuolar-type H+-ATPase subunit C/Vma6